MGNYDTNIRLRLIVFTFSSSNTYLHILNVIKLVSDIEFGCKYNTILQIIADQFKKCS